MRLFSSTARRVRRGQKQYTAIGNSAKSSSISGEIERCRIREIGASRGPTMKSISIGLLAFATIFVSVATAQSRGNPVISTHVNGAYAAVQASLTTDSGYASVIVTINRGLDPTSTSTLTNVFYNISKSVFAPGVPVPTYVSD